MKKLNLLILTAIVVSLIGSGCGKTKKNENGSPSFTFTVTPSSTYTHLPRLQSFVLAQSGQYWLIFGGRTNGFHGFGSQQDFPFSKSNQWIYVYNTTNNALDSMSVNFLPVPVRDQFISSNMQHAQTGNYLYVCGGYGETSTPDSNWSTYSTITRVDVGAMVTAVLTHNSSAITGTVAYDSHPIVQATGGELFRLQDSSFYLVVGHRFTGIYGNGSASQVYLDSVHIFRLIETTTTIQVDPASFQYLSDNLNDSVTQFRRRDLVVAPAVQSDNSSIGLTIYGGVFTYGPNGGPWYNPIYITGGPTPAYQLDQSFTQPSNIYSAANIPMYDSASGRMFTTIFGGMGDSVLVNGDNAPFTNLILTINRDVRGSSGTSHIYNPASMPSPGYWGSESFFVTAPGAPRYQNNMHDIIDYGALPLNQPVTLGYIYGGIKSDSTQWNNQPAPGQPLNLTHSTSAVYEVKIIKN